MAILLTERPKNLTEYPNSFKRQGAFPLDSTLCWYSLAAAKAYAQTDKTAYVGQIITVIENNSVTHYTIIDIEGNLEPVGTSGNTPSGDASLILNCGSATSIIDSGELIIRCGSSANS